MPEGETRTPVDPEEFPEPPQAASAKAATTKEKIFVCADMCMRLQAVAASYTRAIGARFTAV